MPSKAAANGHLPAVFLLALVLVAPGVVESGWNSTGPMSIIRTRPSMTVMFDGTVLVVGGETSIGTGLETDVFDPATGLFVPTTPASGIHYASATSVLLPDGRVLMTVACSAEIYDPGLRSWTPVPPGTCHLDGTLGLLANGKALRVGGSTTGTASVFDPATTSWTHYPGVVPAVKEPTALRLPDGRVLIAGGRLISGSSAVATVTLYDPATGVFASGPPMAAPRARHTATLLADGKVMVVGGDNGQDGGGRVPLATTEIFDPAGGGTWTAGPAMFAPRSHHTAGLSTGPALLTTTETYDPATTSWSTSALDDLPRGNVNHAAVLLPSGAVLVAGGDGRTALQHFPSNATWVATSSMSTLRADFTTTVLKDGTVLVAGGEALNGLGALGSAEVFDPVTATWRAVGALNHARADHTATLLPDGRVLVTGGRLTTPTADSINVAELYDPASETWSITGSMGTARSQHAAVAMGEGSVLIVGGLNGTSNDLPVELWTVGQFLPAAQPPSAFLMTQPNGVLLPDGRILLVYVAQAWLYSPSTSSWAAAQTPLGSRSRPTLTLLPSGKVLLGRAADRPRRSSSTPPPAPGRRRGLWPRPASAVRRRCSPTAGCS